MNFYHNTIDYFIHKDKSLLSIMDDISDVSRKPCCEFPESQRRRGCAFKVYKFNKYVGTFFHVTEAREHCKDLTHNDFVRISSKSKQLGYDIKKYRYPRYILTKDNKFIAYFSDHVELNKILKGIITNSELPSGAFISNIMANGSCNATGFIVIRTIFDLIPNDLIKEYK